MPKLLRSCRLPLVLLIALLAACGKHEDNAATPQSTESPPAADRASQAQEEAAATAACEGNPLAKAMPPKTAINGLPFRTWDCTFNSIHAVYGTEGGKEVEISLTDTLSPDIDKQPAMQDFYRRTFNGQRAMAQSTVQLLTSTIDGFKANPGLLELIGGPDYEPVAESSATGDPILIQIGRKDEQSPAEVIAVFKQRHVFHMQANDKDGATTGMNGPQARALYDPFLKELQVDKLP
jgi:predicted outer membrane protein